VKDLKFKEGVTVINEPNEMIAKVVQPAAARRAEADAMEAAEGEAKEGEAAAEE
jgi:hypothetical protein